MSSAPPALASVVTAADLYPPTTPFDQIPSSYGMHKQIAEMNQQMHNQIDYLNAKRDYSVGKLMKTPLGLALVVFAIVMLVLFLVNPPLTQKNTGSTIEEGKQDFWKMVLFAGIVAALAYLSPIIYKKLCDAQDK